MKLFVKYEEGDDEGAHMNTKFTVPKSWRPGPVSKLLGFAVDTYNGKHADATLDLANVHFEFDGDALGLEDIVEAVLKTKDEVLIKPGASRPLGDKAKAAADAEAAAAAEAEAKRVFAIGKITCKNFGCNKKYSDATNFDGECRHHSKPPVFHETAKYWSCCPHKKAYDWDSFMEIKGCAHGKHSDVKPGAGNVALGGAHVRGDAGPGGPKLKKIEDFNRGKQDLTPLESLKHALIAIGCSAADFESAVGELKKKFDDDESEVLAELATEFGFGLHNLIGTCGSGGPPPPPAAAKK